MGKLLVITALAFAVAIDAALAQEDVPSFEVVSVRINRSGSQRQDMRLLPGGRASVTNAPLRRVILTAYGMLPQQLIGGPAWLETERFDIVAQARENLAASAPGGAPGRAQLMLQRLLTARFNLVAHTETRELHGSGHRSPRATDGELT